MALVNTPKERFDICQKCEHLFQPTATCKKCGCFMRVKVRFRKSECPLGLWGAMPQNIGDTYDAVNNVFVSPVIPENNK